MDNIFILLIMCIVLLEIDKKYILMIIIFISCIYFIFIQKGKLNDSFTKEDDSKDIIPLTKDNPFGNNLPYIEKGNTPFKLDFEPAVFSEKTLKEYINVNEEKTSRDLYYEDIYRPLEDYFDKKSAYRQFYNNPDRDGFSDFLYGEMKSCKDRTDYCMPYYDNRTNRI